MSAATIFTLASGGWLVVGATGRTTIISPLPAMAGQPATALAQALRDWADDVERIASEATGAPTTCVRIIDVVTGEVEESTLDNLNEACELTADDREACARALKDFGAWEFGNTNVGRKRIEVMP